MNARLAGTAYSLHNLAVAANFGGSLFGQVALHPAVKTLRDRKERGELVHQAWQRFSPANALGLITVPLSWFAGRTVLTGRELDGQTRQLVLAKDVAVGLYTLGGLGALLVGMTWGQRQPPIESGNQPAAETSELDTRAQKATNFFGRLNLVAAAAIIVLSTALDMKGGRSAKWTLLSKLVP